eukprot:CAMPEP_0203734502 /NCGR_PEP_ID=MMETSP0092-20131115/30095_1 /ASSEMBLY_ACC=CAM_ASM_001090 /TAXON_ID=426623 /ORGANISM="Chaetoceros affinis, Strain CCMP159" /LENGTH=52 /DNA_ID=CAMNT_0050618769 /DNA_START=86 /DNA_END=241 /DNA_ORIENTATION=+
MERPNMYSGTDVDPNNMKNPFTSHERVVPDANDALGVPDGMRKGPETSARDW